MFAFFKRLSSALDTIQTLPAVSRQLGEVDTAVSTLRWKVDTILASWNDTGKESENELYEVEKNIQELKKHLSAINTERLLVVLRNMLEDNIATGISHLRIVYTYSDENPEIRELILRTFREEIFESFTSLGTEANYVVNNGDVVEINSLLKTELDNATCVSGMQNSFLADFIETHYSDERIAELKNLPGVNELVENTFTFEDVLLLDDRSIQLILREIQSDSLILALKGASEEMQGKVFKNMSRRAAEMLREDLENKGPVRLSEVMVEQKSILSVIRRLSDEGQVLLRNKGEGYLE